MLSERDYRTWAEEAVAHYRRAQRRLEAQYNNSLQRSSDMPLSSAFRRISPLYFEDTCISLCVENAHIKITALANALCSGKTCQSVKLLCNDPAHGSIRRILKKNGIATVRELYAAMFAHTPIEGLTYLDATQKGIHTYSPYVAVKPIKRPAKWTKERLWRAILADQIYKGQVAFYSSFVPDGGSWITDMIRGSADYHYAVPDMTRDELRRLAKRLIEDDLWQYDFDEDALLSNNTIFFGNSIHGYRLYFSLNGTEESKGELA